jgi:hypothetical protein
MWAEATYLTVYHTRVCYKIEIPQPFPIEAQIATVETLMNALKGKFDPLAEEKR